MFGRRRKNRSDHLDDPTTDEFARVEGSAPGDNPDDVAFFDGGPYDIDALDEDEVGTSRLDLGSVLVPIPQGGQIQVEMLPTGARRRCTW